MHAGLASDLVRGAHDLSLTEDQRDALDSIEATLASDDDGIRTASREFRRDLIAGVSRGGLDASKLAGDGAVVEVAMANHHAKETSALQSLHAMLDATERAGLVAGVRAARPAFDATLAPRATGGDADGGDADWARARLDALTAALALDPGQQKQVAAILQKAGEPPDSTEMEARWEERQWRANALLAAFAKEAFDASKVDLTIFPGKSARDTTERLVALVGRLLPVLRPDQRGMLAASLDHPWGRDRPADRAPRSGWPPHNPFDDVVFPFSEPPDAGAQAGAHRG